MTWLVDTNVISELRKGKHCHSGVATWYERIQSSDLYLSVLVVGEIRKGVEAARRKDPPKAVGLERWLGLVVASFAERILPVDHQVAEAWGRMTAIRPIPVIDGLLAATAKVHDLTFVTRNAAHVSGLGALILNPFELGP